MKTHGHLWGGALLVAGTAIGGGMLALPVLTAAVGFWPSVLVFLICWLFMVGTGFLFAEIFLWQKEENNIVSMAKLTLGMPGQLVAWCLYLFLFYSLTIAYTSAGGNLVSDVLVGVPRWVTPLIFVAIFAPFVVVGPKAVDRLNWVLMVGLFLSFFLFFFSGVGRVRGELLQHMDWSHMLLAIPVIFTSFGFQGLVPTLTNYLGRDSKRVKRAILWGSSLPFCLYIVWEILILGVVPLPGLEVAQKLGQSAVYPLKATLHLSWLYTVGEFFAFFAIVTSFLGVTLGLLDFLADGFNIKKSVGGKLFLATLIFAPSTVVAMTNPCLFLNALSYGGGFGCAILLGLLPITMAFSGRYILKKEGEQLLGGGWPLLTLMAIFIIVVVSAMFAKIG
ncbi:MAG: tyrosine transporter [Chlamydiales bacterium]|nr:tyrosine transporter [Chlamydiales bacterium]